MELRRDVPCTYTHDPTCIGRQPHHMSAKPEPMRLDICLGFGSQEKVRVIKNMDDAVQRLQSFGARHVVLASTVEVSAAQLQKPRHGSSRIGCFDGWSVQTHFAINGKVAEFQLRQAA